MRFGTTGLRSCRTLGVRGMAACFLVIWLLAATVKCHAQLNDMVTINGRVTDTTGAVVPGAAVSIINTGTGTVTSTTSNNTGDFSVVGLNVGTYSVKVAKATFQAYEEENFYVGPTQVYTVNAILKAGSGTSSIEVEANAVQVETSTNEISSEVSGHEAEMLALDGQNYQQLSTLMPGVTNLSAGNSMATGGYLWNNAVSVNGMGRSSVLYTLDGIWNQELGDLLTNTVTPDPESIDEVKLLQNNFSVQYNMLGGAVMMVHTKEGTDQFHGQAWYFYRNGAFNALNYFVLPNINPPFEWNIGGAGLGGPLLIPHLYNTDRKKTFFYINAQYVHQTTYDVLQADDPTPAEVDGIFPTEIHNPVTQSDYPSSAGGPNGIQYTIPQSQIIPSAQALLRALVPPPNHASTCTSSDDAICESTDNYDNDNPVFFKQLDTMAKIDQILTPRLRLTAEYFREGVKDQLDAATRASSDYPYNWNVFYNNDSVAQIHLTQQLSNTMLNITSAAMNRYIVTNNYGGIHLASQVPGFTEDLAYPSTIIGLPGQWLPDITFADGWTPFGANSNYTQWRTAYLAETFTDNWTWLRGKHSFAAGATLVLGRSRIDADGDNTSGTFNFNGDYTGTPIADFLTGYANTYEQGSNDVRKKLTYPIYSPYAEDQWKILPRLTLTLGARYNFMPFANAQQGYATAFNPAAFVSSQAPQVNIDGLIITSSTYNPVNGLSYNGYNGIPLNLSSAHQNYVSPSVGFAWDVYGDGQTSLRGGFSINYIKSGSSSDCEATCIGQPAVNEIELSDASFPDPLNGKTTQPTAASVSGEDMKNIQAGKVYTYSLSVQQQFGANWLAQIAFAGIAGRDLPLELNINQPLPYESYAYNPALLTSGAGNAYYAPYGGYDTITYATSTGIANWNAMELSLRHPVGHSVLFRAQFTWAHGLSDIPGQAGYAQENSGVQNSYHPTNDYGNSELNQSLNYSSDVIYQAPWFTRSGWTRTAFGGWELSVLTAFEAGVSLSPGLSTSDHGLATRPDINPAVAFQRYHGAHPDTMINGPFFNTCAFMVPNEQTSCSPSSQESPYFDGEFGNAPVGLIRGPGTILNDVSLFKLFPVKNEAATIRARITAYNLTNHPNFDGEDVNLGDTNFGYYTQAADPREMEFSIAVLW